MAKKITPLALLAALWMCLALVGGCAPQTAASIPPEATPTPGPQSSTTISSSPEQPSGALEGILVEFGSYTQGEEKWAVLHDQDQITLLTVTPEISVTGGPLKEGQRVAVTCQEILTIYPSLFYQVSAVEVLGETSSEEWENALATVEKQENSLKETEELANERKEETMSGE